MRIALVYIIGELLAPQLVVVFPPVYHWQPGVFRSASSCRVSRPLLSY